MNKEKLVGTYSMRKWTDIIDKIVIDRIFGAIEEKRRLVGTGLYTEEEYLEAIESLLLENDISSKHILRFLSLLSKNKERLDELLEQIYEQANLKK